MEMHDWERDGFAKRRGGELADEDSDRQSAALLVEVAKAQEPDGSESDHQTLSGRRRWHRGPFSRPSCGSGVVERLFQQTVAIEFGLLPDGNDDLVAAAATIADAFGARFGFVPLESFLRRAFADPVRRQDAKIALNERVTNVVAATVAAIEQFELPDEE